MMILATLYKPNINADAKHTYCVLLKFVTHNFLQGCGAGAALFEPEPEPPRSGGSGKPLLPIRTTYD